MSKLIDIDDEKFWDVLFDEACVEGNQAERIKNKLEKIVAFDMEKVVEQLNNVLQDLNVIEVIDHIVFDSTIQTSLENFLNAFKSEIMRIVKNNACIDELLKGEEG